MTAEAGVVVARECVVVACDPPLASTGIGHTRRAGTEAAGCTQEREGRAIRRERASEVRHIVARGREDVAERAAASRSVIHERRAAEERRRADTWHPPRQRAGCVVGDGVRIGFGVAVGTSGGGVRRRRVGAARRQAAHDPRAVVVTLRRKALLTLAKRGSFFRLLAPLVTRELLIALRPAAPPPPPPLPPTPPVATVAIRLSRPYRADVCRWCQCCWCCNACLQPRFPAASRTRSRDGTRHRRVCRGASALAVGVAATSAARDGAAPAVAQAVAQARSLVCLKLAKRAAEEFLRVPGGRGTGQEIRACAVRVVPGRISSHLRVEPRVKGRMAVQRTQRLCAQSGWR